MRRRPQCHPMHPPTSSVPRGDARAAKRAGRAPRLSRFLRAAARAIAVAALAGCVPPRLFSAPPGTELPAWADGVGARQRPGGSRIFFANSYGASGDGVTPATLAIQRALDACSQAGGGIVAFKPGTYLTAALFLKSRVHLRIDEGVTLLGSRDEAAYPIIPTRVAGIEMPWPAALINVNGQTDVEVSGGGVIDGQGDYWWKKYWGSEAAAAFL